MELDNYLMLSILKYFRRPFLIKLKKEIRNRVISTRIYELLFLNSVIENLSELPLNTLKYGESTPLSNMARNFLISAVNGESSIFMISKSTSFLGNCNYELSNFLLYFFIKRLEIPNSKTLLITKSSSVILEFFQIADQISDSLFSKSSKVIKERSGVTLMKRDTKSEVLTLFQSSSYLDFVSGLIEESVYGLCIIIYKAESLLLQDIITQIFLIDKYRKIGQILILIDQFEPQMKDSRIVSVDNRSIIQESAKLIRRLTECRINCNFYKVLSKDLFIE